MAAVVLALGVLAFLSPGLVQADVVLDEGTVHIAKQDTSMLGVFNTQIDQLSNSRTAGDSELRILQDDNVVLVHGVETSTLMEYDPARNATGSATQLPSDARVELTGGTLMVVNPDNGKVWFGPPKAISKLDFQKEKAHLEVGDFGNATLTADGDVIGIDIQRSVLVRSGEEDELGTPLPFTIDPEGVNFEISAVGNRAVVLDRASGRIWMEGMSKAFEVSGASSAKLLNPVPDALGGEDGAKAMYVTQAGLIALTNDGPRSLSGNLDAEPIQPVQVGACVYAVFGTTFLKHCRGVEDEPVSIPGAPDTPDEVLAFQVSRSTVVLNDVLTGVLWLVDKEMQRIDDWQRVTLPDDSTEDSLSQVQAETPLDRTLENKKPIAKDDDLAARAGRSTILNVLDNDTDPDGDILTISAQPEVSGATLQRVRGGTGLQITLDSTASGVVTFPYTISDGRKGSASAEVTVRVLPSDPAVANSAPYKLERAVPVVMSRDQKITKRVLMDWRDPDGDSLILVNAWLPPNSEDEVTFTPDGDVSFRDIGKTAGTKKVFVTVSDGHTEKDGEMLISVIDDIAEPIAHGDFATTAAGKAVEVHPLENDVGTRLSLLNVEADGGGCECTIDPNYSEKSFSFSAEDPGTYYVLYKVSNGSVKTGLVRIDVKAETKNSAPVAALDVALLPPGGFVTIDPVLNDTDEDGDVLLVQSVSQGPGLQVELKRRHLVSITAQYTITEPVTLTYWLSDGKHQVLGTIVVIPTPSTGSTQPQAEPDEVKIRAGATQLVDVLENDTSPIGLPLELDTLVENPGNRAWPDGNNIRVSVPDGTAASNINIVYQIRDSEGGIASARLRVTVVSEDAQNEAPTPRPVVERVLAGTASRLIIPMAGIDPNGDAVRLLGLGSAPTLGRVMGVGDGWFSYEAFPDSKGTDVFRYQVIDSLGAIGFGEIKVGVASAGAENSPPLGKPDKIAVRPGRHVQISALKNDVDIDGDRITYAREDPVEIEGIDDVEIIGHRDISFTAPEEPGLYTGTYRIEDVRGLPGSGDLLITVDEEAPLLDPVTRDDVVPVSAVLGKEWVVVDVTSNDTDPDGRQEDLRVEVPEYSSPDGQIATATEDGRRARVPVTERMQQIRYEVVDLDGNRAVGIILVPGRSDSVPVLKDPNVMLEAVAGQTLSINVNAHVAGTAGRTVGVKSADTVKGTHGTAFPSGGVNTVDYTPDITYEGPASVVFEVGDVVNEGDKTDKRAYISIPIKVAPAPNRPADGGPELSTARTSPELINQGSIPVLKVGPGEGETRLDLKPLFTDADGDSFRFVDFGHASGDKAVIWRVTDEGASLFASTDIKTPRGTEHILNARVVDANNNGTPFQIRLEVTSSTRPTATVVADTEDALAGQEILVDVLANDKSNLPDRPKLRVTGASVISGSGTAKEVGGERVAVTPAAGFVGTLTARYTVMDATEDPDRRVDGTIRVTVKDHPSRPGAPRDGVVGDGTVTFTYTAGSSNGFDVDERTAVAVTASGAEIALTQCKSTTCTVTGLANDEPYSFKVREHNEAGYSDWSPSSAPYTPDVKPNAPGQPQIRYGDKQLTAEWAAPTWQNATNPGSKVTHYSLELLDEAGIQRGLKDALPASSTTHTWTGLKNGERYRFRVKALNKAGWSPDSEMSAVEWPAGPPSAPGSLKTIATANPLGGAFDVTFDPSVVDPNGDPVSQFIVTPISRAGEVPDKAKTVVASGTAEKKVTIEGLGQQDYKFKVVAQNKTGPGVPATTSAWQVAWELPKLSNVTSSVAEGSITVLSSHNFSTRPQANPVTEYQLNGGAWQPLPGDGRISGLTNGKNYNVSLRVKIDGDRASAPAELPNLMPKTAVPPWPTYDPNKDALTGTPAGLLLVLTKFEDRTDTGGWDPDGYRYKCLDYCTVGAWTGSNSFVVPPENLTAGREMKVAIAHVDGDRQTQVNQTLQAPFRGTWDQGSRSFNFTLRYVTNATCTLTAKSTTQGVADEEKTWVQSGGSSFSPPPVQLAEGVAPSSVNLDCKTDLFRQNFTVSDNER